MGGGFSGYLLMGDEYLMKKGQVIFKKTSKPVFYVKIPISYYQLSQDSKQVLSFLLRLLELPEFNSEK